MIRFFTLKETSDSLKKRCIAPVALYKRATEVLRIAILFFRSHKMSDLLGKPQSKFPTLCTSHNRLHFLIFILGRVWILD